MENGKYILGASIGNCVHVAGILHFLALAEGEGYKTKFLGPATPLDALFAAIRDERPDIVSISYRLTPENAALLLDEIDERRRKLEFDVRWEFGGTKPVADIAREHNFFEFISDGYDDVGDSLRYLRGLPSESSPESYGKVLVDRIEASYPYPILRHHFGRPTLQETEEGIRAIAEAGVLDVVSLGTDQNAQQFFFKPELMRDEFSGAGGVPVRSSKDFRVLKDAAQRGNYPLVRCYSGTDDVFDYAELLVETIDNAWAAIPLCWYNELDGRSTRPLEQSMGEAMDLIRWHAERGVPVEINEPHHWGLRDAHDVIPVAMAYICAYNAKKLGVQNYIAQYMFNNPNGLSFSMDLAKILAMIELVESLADDDFSVYREVRTGLALLGADKDVAKGQLAASTFMQMMTKPHIIHVVGYCEADHAARASEVIESCKIVKGVVRHVLEGCFSAELDPVVLSRRDELISEARVLLEFIESEYSDFGDPLANAEVLCDCIRNGYIDAMHIVKNEKYIGNLATRIVGGKCIAVDPDTGEALSEKDRLLSCKRRAKEARRGVDGNSLAE